MTIRAAVLASGGGTNLQALLDWPGKAGAWEIALVVSDRSDAGALDRARSAGVPARVVDPRASGGGDPSEPYLSLFEGEGIDAVLLAGYLRLLPAGLVSSFRGRIVNVHPALLPAFGGKGMYGLRVHEAVIASGASLSGVTIHLVDERYDEGRILAQWPVPVLFGESAEQLAARVLRVEHLLYPRVADALLRAIGRERAGEDPPPFVFRPPEAAFLTAPEDATALERQIVAALAPHPP